MTQIWTYSILYFIWAIPNIMIGLAKFRDSESIDKVKRFLLIISHINQAESGQFFLIFNINFYVSMWNSLFAQEIAGNIGLILVAILNLFIWASNFGTSFRFVQGRRNPCSFALSKEAFSSFYIHFFSYFCYWNCEDGFLAQSYHITTSVHYGAFGGHFQVLEGKK